MFGSSITSQYVDMFSILSIFSPLKMQRCFQLLLGFEKVIGVAFLFTQHILELFLLVISFYLAHGLVFGGVLKTPICFFQY
jgi:hypothetical protein